MADVLKYQHSYQTEVQFGCVECPRSKGYIAGGLVAAQVVQIVMDCDREALAHQTFFGVAERVTIAGHTGLVVNGVPKYGEAQTVYKGMTAGNSPQDACPRTCDGSIATGEQTMAVLQNILEIPVQEVQLHRNT